MYYVLFCFVSIKGPLPGGSQVKLAYAEVQLMYRMTMELTDVFPPIIGRNAAIINIIGTGFYPITGAIPACK